MTNQTSVQWRSRNLSGEWAFSGDESSLCVLNLKHVQWSEFLSEKWAERVAPVLVIRHWRTILVAPSQMCMQVHTLSEAICSMGHIRSGWILCMPRAYPKFRVCWTAESRKIKVNSIYSNFVFSFVITRCLPMTYQTVLSFPSENKEANRSAHVYVFQSSFIFKSWNIRIHRRMYRLAWGPLQECKQIP